LAVQVTLVAPDTTLIVPCFNEEAALPGTSTQLLGLLSELVDSGKISDRSCVCIVDDGSNDGTWDIIESLCRDHRQFIGFRLSRNFGHQNALLAGLLCAPGEALISLDADLQDDLSVIPDMLTEYVGGADLVFGVRQDRSSDSFFKRTTANFFYGLLQRLGVDAVYNHADFRLMSRRAVETLRGYREVNLFLRGLVTDLGYSYATVEYARRPRTAGETSYPVRKMIALALDGITSFSAVPLRLIALVGIAIFFGSLLVSAWALWIRLFTSDAIPGWASSVLPMYLLGGIQLLGIGVVGEYVAKIYLETKARPRFIIRDSLGMDFENPQSSSGKA
jgi:glycosyltransferase involved in cell wall biosynthesis